MAARQRGPARYTGGHRPPLREKLRDLRAHNVRPYGGSCTVCGRMISAPTERENSVNKKIVPLILLCTILCGCQAKEKTPAISAPPPEPAPKTAQELLEEQIINDTHDAFLVDTGGKLGTLLVTVEAVPYEEPVELNTYQHVAIWNPAHMDQPLQTVDWEGGYPGEHQILDVNFDGYPDFTILFARGVQAEGYHCMRWDEEQGLFVEEPEYAAISSPVLDPEARSIFGWNRASGAGDGVSTIHQWVDGELVCVRRIELFAKDWDYDSPFVLTVRDRINDELTEVFREEYPLDPEEEYFEARMKWEDINYHGETR